MRYAVLIMVMLVFALSMAGCSEEFRDVSDTGRDLAVSAVIIVDDFLEGRINGSTARNRIEALNALEVIPIDTDLDGDAVIRRTIFSISNSLLLGANDGVNRVRLIESRDELAVGVGMNRR